MKKIITFLLLLPMISFGQGDTLLMKDYKLDFSDSSLVYIGNVGAIDTLWYRDRYDTVKCLFLVCDTSNKSYITTDYNTMIQTCDSCPFVYKKSIEKYKDIRVYWLYGYVVLKNGWFTKTYLDADKKKLPKNYFVWDCKLIEQ